MGGLPAYTIISLLFAKCCFLLPLSLYESHFCTNRNIKDKEKSVQSQFFWLQGQDETLSSQYLWNVYGKHTCQFYMFCQLNSNEKLRILITMNVAINVSAKGCLYNCPFKPCDFIRKIIDLNANTAWVLTGCVHHYSVLFEQYTEKWYSVFPFKLFLRTFINNFIDSWTT